MIYEPQDFDDETIELDFDEIEQLEGEDDENSMSEQEKLLELMRWYLTEREERILKWYYGLTEEGTLSISKIAEKLETTEEHEEAIVRRAERKLTFRKGRSRKLLEFLE